MSPCACQISSDLRPNWPEWININQYSYISVIKKLLDDRSDLLWFNNRRCRYNVMTFICTNLGQISSCRDIHQWHFLTTYTSKCHWLSANGILKHTMKGCVVLCSLNPHTCVANIVTGSEEGNMKHLILLDSVVIWHLTRSGFNKNCRQFTNTILDTYP